MLLSSVHLPENPSHDLLIEESCKLKFALDLLDLLSSTGHRTLVFSTSRKILDFIQSMIGERVRLFVILISLCYIDTELYNI